jgi:uncharacterized protein
LTSRVSPKPNPPAGKRTTRWFTRVVPLLSAILSIAAGCSSENPYRTETGTVSPDRRMPIYEIYSPEILTPSKDISLTGYSGSEVFPRAAIIIDDIGYDPPITEEFLSLDAPLTFAVLPHSPHRDFLIRKIEAKGRELMIHLPMEPVEYPKVDPGPKALITRMDPNRLLDLLEENLKEIPGAKGVNNHMGSRLTASFADMYRIFSVLKDRHLFFVDSFTTPDSVCLHSARLMRIPFARRDVFLDHSLNPKEIRRQIDRLIRLAETYGEAVAIGHPHRTTLEVLREELPNIRKRVRIVPASRLVHISG